MPSKDTAGSTGITGSWVEHRNKARYNTNIEHGKNYDSKNLMHTFRLLDMAEEIARERTLNRPPPQP